VPHLQQTSIVKIKQLDAFQLLSIPQNTLSDLWGLKLLSALGVKLKLWVLHRNRNYRMPIVWTIGLCHSFSAPTIAHESVRSSQFLSGMLVGHKVANKLDCFKKTVAVVELCLCIDHRLLNFQLGFVNYLNCLIKPFLLSMDFSIEYCFLEIHVRVKQWCLLKF